jgi:hypothetical protein
MSQRYGGDRTPTRLVHPRLAADVRQETSRHRAGTIAAARGAEGLLPVDGIPLSTVVSMKVALGRTPTLR